MRRSFAVGSEMAWAAWGEASGLVRWVGACAQALTEGEQVALADGTRITVVRQVPPKQLRLRLERDDWPRARTVQLRVLPSVHGVTVALHAEGLPDADAREKTLARWTRALESWNAFSGRTVEVTREGHEEDRGHEAAPGREEGRAGEEEGSGREEGPAHEVGRSAAGDRCSRAVTPVTRDEARSVPPRLARFQGHQALGLEQVSAHGLACPLL
ncbi:hypothetical protein D7V80_19695 [Corallococcus sp. CA054B]|nr:hypothetical protein D7V80_19695 [Corallococcus sp. CA054B]